MNPFFGLPVQSALDLENVCWWTVQKKCAFLAFVQQPHWRLYSRGPNGTDNGGDPQADLLLFP